MFALHAALLVLPTVLLADAEERFAPIPTRNHRAVSLAFLRFEPGAALLESGKRSASFGWTQANDFRVEGTDLREDNEVTRLQVSYREGLGATTITYHVPFVYRGGGFMDPLIDGWHRGVLGWSDPARDSTPFGRSEVTLPGSGSRGSAGGLGDVSVEAARRYRGVTGRIAVKLPTGNAGDLLGSGGVDLGVAIESSLDLRGGLHLFGLAGLVWQGDATAIRSERKLAEQAALALVYSPNPRDSWIAQWQSEAAAQRGVRGSAPHRMLTLGYRRRIASGQWLEGYFSEDRDVVNGDLPEVANVGPDFTAGLRWVRRL